MKLLVLTTILVFVSVGFLHAIVPHDHGDEHSSQGIEWAAMHSALAHTDKKVALPSLVLFNVVATTVVAFFFVVRLVPVFDPLCEEARRGRAKYRRFG